MSTEFKQELQALIDQAFEDDALAFEQKSDVLYMIRSDLAQKDQNEPAAFVFEELIRRLKALPEYDKTPEQRMILALNYARLAWVKWMDQQPDALATLQKAARQIHKSFKKMPENEEALNLYANIVSDLLEMSSLAQEDYPKAILIGLRFLDQITRKVEVTTSVEFLQNYASICSQIAGCLYLSDLGADLLEHALESFDLLADAGFESAEPLIQALNTKSLMLMESGKNREALESLQRAWNLFCEHGLKTDYYTQGAGLLANLVQVCRELGENELLSGYQKELESYIS